MSTVVITLGRPNGRTPRSGTRSGRAKIVAIAPPKPQLVHADELKALVFAVRESAGLRRAMKTLRAQIREVEAEIDRTSKDIAARLESGAEVTLEPPAETKE